VRAELEQLRSNVAHDAPPEVKAFLDLHRMILDDSLLCDTPRDLIRSRLINAEWALTIQLEEVCRQFDALDDDYFRSRSQDVRQVVDRVLRHLAGARPPVPAPDRKPSGEGEGMILVASDLAPADMLHFRDADGPRLAGFITELGGPTSHTMILARSLGLPAIVGAIDARERIHRGDLLIIDSDAGEIYVRPDDTTLALFRQRLTRQTEARTALRKLRGKSSRTLDDVPVELMANIEMPDDVQDAIDAGADGVGLFRTEFLFMNRDDLPSEDEQYEAYARVARAMKGKPVVIRTLDIGADKVLNASARASVLRQAEHHDSSTEPNPALGLRAIRYCLAYPELFMTQLRAILRASAEGTVRILVPMLAHVHEIRRLLEYLTLAKEQLNACQLAFDPHIAVGGMIEIPAAALHLKPFCQNLKFLSLGTNDLIQYTLAIDRTDAAVAYLYEPLHPAVLQLVHQTIRTGEKAGIPVSVCGEMAGDLALTELLLGMGLRRFSMNAGQILTVKQRLLELDSRAAARLTARIMRLHDPIDIRDTLMRNPPARHADRRA
jgi:phosphotransferase system enzyme I (PtsI)